MSEYVYHDHPRPFCGKGCPAYGTSPLLQRYPRQPTPAAPRTALDKAIALIKVEAYLSHHAREEGFHMSDEWESCDSLKCARIRKDLAAIVAEAAAGSGSLDVERLGGLIERAIRQSKRENDGRLTDGWTLVKMALAYPPQTPTEPSQPIPAALAAGSPDE